MPVCCADIVERFDTFIFLTLAWVHTAGDSSHQLADAVFYIVIGEIVVDWTKHSFVTKFNRIHHSVYGDFLETLALEMLPKNQADEARVDPTQVIARRVGLGVLPLSCVSARFLLTHVVTPMATSSVDGALWLRGGIFVMGFLCLVAAKLLLGSLLMYSSCKYVNRKMRKREEAMLHGGLFPSSTFQNEHPDLSKVDRYSLFKGRIPT
jgi:hypothetical protein